MAKFKVDVNASKEAAAEAPEPAAEAASAETANGAQDDTLRNVATVGVIAVGVALLDAALIPGMIVGGVAVLAPKIVPKIGERLQPLVRSTLRGAYKLGKKARSAVAEAQEQVHDIVAEVRAEDTGAAAAPPASTPA